MSVRDVEEIHGGGRKNIRNERRKKRKVFIALKRKPLRRLNTMVLFLGLHEHRGRERNSHCA